MGRHRRSGNGRRSCCLAAEGCDIVGGAVGNVAVGEKLFEPPLIQVRNGQLLNVKKPRAAIGFGVFFVLFGIAGLIFSSGEGAGKLVYLVALVVPGVVFIIAGARALGRGSGA